MMDQLMKDLEHDEGRVKWVYEDHLGYYTIGVGFLVDKRQNGGLYDEEIDFILKNRIRHTMREMDRNIPWWNQMPESAQRALINMCYNLGWPRLSKFEKMLANLKHGYYNAAASEALDSLWAKQVKGRADRIAELFKQAERSNG